MLAVVIINIFFLWCERVSPPHLCLLEQILIKNSINSGLQFYCTIRVGYLISTRTCEEKVNTHIYISVFFFSNFIKYVLLGLLSEDVRVYLQAGIVKKKNYNTVVCLVSVCFCLSLTCLNKTLAKLCFY